MNRHEGMTQEQVEELWPSDRMDLAKDEATLIDKAFDRWAGSLSEIDDLAELNGELLTVQEEIGNAYPEPATPDQLGCMYAVKARMAEVERGQAATWRSMDARDLLIEFTRAVVELTRWERTQEEAGREAEFWEGLTGPRAKEMVDAVIEREEQAEVALTSVEELVERMHVVIVERMTPAPPPALVPTPDPEA